MPAKKKAAKKKVAKRKPGRPRIEFDLEMVEKLAKFGCTHEEIAIWFGATVDTVKRRKKDWAEFCAAIESGRANFHMSIRREQWKLAQKGNATMLIWLGKQCLGQRDRAEIIKDDRGTRKIVFTVGGGKKHMPAAAIEGDLSGNPDAD